MNAGQNDRALPIDGNWQDRIAALRGTLRFARALAEMRRPIDLAGLETQVGQLCAACLDLAPADGAYLRVLLRELAGEIDALDAMLRQFGPRHEH
jgi:hypothetical protein